MDCYTSFQCLGNLLSLKIFVEFYKMNMINIKKYILVLEELANANVPKITQHFRELGLTTDMFIMDWILTLYSRPLPLDIALRVWDFCLIERTCFIFRVAVGILKYGAKTLENGDFEDCLYWLTHLSVQNIVEDDLFDCIKSVKFTVKACNEQLECYNLL